MAWKLVARPGRGRLRIPLEELFKGIAAIVE